jgi:hypothetical protein
MVKSSDIEARPPERLIMIIGKAKMAPGCRDSALWLIDQTGYRIFPDETELKIKIHGRNWLYTRPLWALQKCRSVRKYRIGPANRDLL